MLEARRLGRQMSALRGARERMLPLTVELLSYGVGRLTILDGVSVVLNAEGCTVIMGFNGAGKSVLLRLLHGLLQASAGRIAWAADLPPRELARRQAMIFQQPVLLRRSVADNIRFAMKVRGLDKHTGEQRLAQLLDEAHLQHLAARPAAVLSGGEKQRVALARALSVEPEVLFLDEPTANLDPVSAQAIESLARRAAARGTKLILVTQDAGQAKRFANDVVFLHHGRVTEHTAAATFFTSPHSAAARAFIAGRVAL